MFTFGCFVKIGWNGIEVETADKYLLFKAYLFITTYSYGDPIDYKDQNNCGFEVK